MTLSSGGHDIHCYTKIYDGLPESTCSAQVCFIYRALAYSMNRQRSEVELGVYLRSMRMLWVSLCTFVQPIEGHYSLPLFPSHLFRPLQCESYKMSQSHVLYTAVWLALHVQIPLHVTHQRHSLLSTPS